MMREKHKELVAKTPMAEKKREVVSREGYQGKSYLFQHFKTRANFEDPDDFFPIPKAEKIPQYEKPLPQQPKSENSEIKELMSLIVGLNNSVRQLSSRFDNFQSNIEGKVNRMQTEMVLMKNKVEFLE